MTTTEPAAPTVAATRPAARPRDAVSDHDALAATAAVVAAPRDAPGDSFVLHAPLEALARTGLLSHVAPGDRDDVVARIAAIGEEYDGYRAWAGADASHRSDTIRDEAGARRLLGDSIAGSDFEGVDAAVRWLTSHLTADELVGAVVDPVVPSLAAAAHGSIFLHLLPRVAAGNLPAATMLRTTAHELARHPQWRIDFVDRLPAADGRSSADAAAELARRLARPLVEPPDSNFIRPTMNRVEETGLARAVVADVAPSLTVADARRVLLRTAAHSMLQDDPAHAPYGWTHCLTMPQATLGVAPASARPEVAVAVAATYVLGFRATQGAASIDLAWTPSADGIRPGTALDLDAPPGTAAAHAWFAPAAAHPGIRRALAAHAGAHHDAHLAKYTLACLDAAREDPPAEHLFLAAAAYLNAWWRHRPS